MDVTIKFRGDGGNLLSTQRRISGENRTLLEQFEAMRTQGRRGFVEASKGATALAQTLGVSLTNARDFASGLGLTAQAATQAAQRFAQLDAAGATTTQKYRALRSEFGLSRNAFLNLSATFNQGTQATQRLAQSLGISLSAARNFAREIGLSASRTQAAVERYRELSRVGADLTEKQRVLTQELGLSREQFNAIRGSVVANKEALQQLAVVTGGVATALGAIGARGVQVFTEFDSVIRQFGVISGATAEQTALVTDEIERLGAATVNTPQEIAELTVELSRAGFTAEQTREALNGIALAAQATGSDISSTGQVIGSVLNQFQLDPDQANRVADLLVATANNSATSIEDLGEALKLVGTQAKNSNQSLEDTLLSLGTLANSGLRGTIAGTSLGEAMRRLERAAAGASSELTELAGKGTKKAVAAFKQLAQEVTDSQGNLISYPAAVEKINAALNGLSRGDRVLLADAIFGVQGSRGFLAQTGAAEEKINQLRGAIENSEGAAQRAGDALNQGPAAALRILEANTETALKSVGELLSQGFLPFINGASALVTTFNSLPGPVQATVVGIGSFTAALAGAIAALTTFQVLGGAAFVTQAIQNAQALGSMAAGFVANTAAATANTAAVGTNAGALGLLSSVYGILNSRITLTTVATKALAIAKASASAASVAWAAVTSGSLVPALIAGGKAMAGMAASAVTFLPVAFAIGGAIALLQEAFTQLPAEKFASDVEKSTDALRGLQDEANKPPSGAEEFLDKLGDSYLRFGDRVNKSGVIEALRATFAEFGQGAGPLSEYGEQLSVITREQLANQRATLALEDRQKETNKTIDGSLAILKEYGLTAKEAATANALNADETAKFNAAAKAQITTIEAQIESLEKLQAGAANDTQRNLLDNQIKLLERSKNTLQQRSRALTGDAQALKTNNDAKKEAIKLEKELEDLVKKAEAIQKQASSGRITSSAAEEQLRALTASEKNREQLTREVSERIVAIRRSEVRRIQELVRDGVQSEAEALQELAQIQSSTTNAQARRVAARAAVQIRQDQIEAEIQVIRAGEEAIRAQVAQGNKNEIDAERELTQLKISEIEKRIQSARQEASVAVGSEQKAVLAEVQKLEAQKQRVTAESVQKIRDIQAKAQEDERKAAIAAFDTQLKVLEASFANRELSESDYYQQRADLQNQQIDAEISQLRQSLGQLEAEDKAGRDRITAQIADAQIRRAAIVQEGYKRQLDELRKFQDAAIAEIEQAEAERNIAIQRQQNAGTITQQRADALRANSTRERLRQELDAVRNQQAEIEAIETSSLSPQAAEELEQRKREARRRTTDLTLQLLQQEARAQEAARQAAVDSIQRELAERQRGFDLQIDGLNNVRQAQVQTAREAEANAQRQAQAYTIASNALQRQNSLLQAQGRLVQAQNSLAQTETGIDLQRLSRAEQLLQRLQQGNISLRERAEIEQQLNQEGISSSTSQTQLAQQRADFEARLQEQKQQALQDQQALEQASLQLETRRNEIASERAVTEARINELKAEQAILTAQTALEEQRINNARAIAEAQAEVETAQVGGDSGEIEAARQRLALVEAGAVRSEAAAEQGITIAQRQLELARQGTTEAEKARENNQQLAVLAQQTLDIQQQQAQRQLEAAQYAERQAAALNMARAAAADTARFLGNVGGGQTVEARYEGGPVSPGNAYTIAEKGPELIKFQNKKSALIQEPGLYQVPTAGTVLNAADTRRELNRSIPRPADVSTAAGRRSESAEIAQRIATETDVSTLEALGRIQQAIEGKKRLSPANITVQSGDDRTVEKLMRSMLRSGF